MTLSAYITLDRDGFHAALSDGRALRAPEIRALAAMLVSAGVHVDHALCADWRDVDAAPGAGHAIALKAEMRRLRSSEASTMSGYDKDFYVWAQQQADLLRARRFDEIDRFNLIEEVESMARQVARELEDRMADIVRLRLLLHALPGHDWAPFWQLNLRQQCRMNALILEDAPSLKGYLATMLPAAIETGRLRAVEELAYAFPNRRFEDEFASMPLLEITDLIG